MFTNLYTKATGFILKAATSSEELAGVVWKVVCDSCRMTAALRLECGRAEHSSLLHHWLPSLQHQTDGIRDLEPGLAQDAGEGRHFGTKNAHVLVSE